MMPDLSTNDTSACPLCGSGSHPPEHLRHSLLRCSSCGLVYAGSFGDSPQLYDDAYNVAGEYDEYLRLAEEAAQGKLHLMWGMRRFFDENRNPGRLLDVGCSTGRFMLAAKRRGWETAGVEIAPTAAEVARRLTGAPVHAGTLPELEKTETFDAVTAWEVLEHVTKPADFIARAVAVVRPGGRLCISVPNWESPWMRVSPLAEHWPPYHLTYWSPAPLRRLMREAGLKNIMIGAKPFAWKEELGRRRWPLLPVSLFQGYVLRQKGMHLYATGVKP